MEYETLKVMVLSTSHITKDDADTLDLYNIDFDWILKDDYSWWILADNHYINIVLKDKKRQPFSKYLTELLARAESEGCLYIRLDESGKKYNNLPRFEW